MTVTLLMNLKHGILRLFDYRFALDRGVYRRAAYLFTNLSLGYQSSGYPISTKQVTVVYQLHNIILGDHKCFDVIILASQRSFS